MMFMSPDVVAELGRQHRQQLLDEAEADRALRAAKMASGLLNAAHRALDGHRAHPTSEGDAPVEQCAACPAPRHAA